ncbi:hypothetical protein OESDEN_11357 [Oesophagostomum dentatum]|uniref:ATP-dependent DNA helicase n=1 Tax=Oesophagostomum dentatum TaxID=61180 RepID=A0A0B1SV47_OESDE|nr:hypothetical protein OESDEN_11357 [Oesophagostomum dentatum]
MLIDSKSREPAVLDNVENVDVANEFALDMSDLNTEQTNVMDKLIECASLEKTTRIRCFFLYGKAGYGKAFLFREFFEALKALNRKVLTVASMGIAATLLLDGPTAQCIQTFSEKSFGGKYRECGRFLIAY